METHKMVRNSTSQEEDTDLRRGPWTVDEDLVLMSYITNNGEGHWNSLARCAGLKRTGKSCRLRWLNYLRPDVRRGNITPEEQLLILELNSRWGNQWSKIAQYLPGRTDNEIKNYWRTRVQKHAKQLQCDVNSKQFKDVIRYLWMPRLVERIRAASGSSSGTADSIIVDTDTNINQMKQVSPLASKLSSSMAVSTPSDSLGSSSSPLPLADGLGDCLSMSGGEDIANEENRLGTLAWWCTEPLPSPGGHGYLGSLDFDQSMWGDAMSDNLWSADDIWFLQHML